MGGKGSGTNGTVVRKFDDKPTLVTLQGGMLFRAKRDKNKTMKMNEYE